MCHIEDFSHIAHPYSVCLVPVKKWVCLNIETHQFWQHFKIIFMINCDPLCEIQASLNLIMR